MTDERTKVLLNNLRGKNPEFVARIEARIKRPVTVTLESMEWAMVLGLMGAGMDNKEDQEMIDTAKRLRLAIAEQTGHVEALDQ